MQHPISATSAAAAAMAVPLTTLSPDEQVTDHTLRLLAKGDAQRACGIISDEHHAILCATLTDILGELLALRTVARKGLA
jgi:hypothetical protein